MRRVIVEYKVKPDRLAEHEGLVHAVFAELSRTAPPGIRYGAFKRADGLSFVHFASISAERSPLETIAALKAFGAEVKDRCEVPPQVTELVEVGAFEI